MLDGAHLDNSSKIPSRPHLELFSVIYRFVGKPPDRIREVIFRCLLSFAICILGFPSLNAMLISPTEYVKDPFL